jgi:hypothetical protein
MSSQAANVDSVDIRHHDTASSYYLLGDLFRGRGHEALKGLMRVWGYVCALTAAAI